MEMRIRRIRAEDWEIARCVRLAALADAPDAFARTLAQELQMPEARWRERALGNAEGRSSVGFLGVSEGVECAMVVGILPEGSQCVELNALWVAANARGRGVGRALVQAVCAWGRQRGATEVALEVVETSTAARALYAALGFEPSGPAAPTCGERRAKALPMRKALAQSQT